MSQVTHPRRRPEGVIWRDHPSWRGMLGWYFKWEGLAILLSALTVLIHQKADRPSLLATVFIVIVLNGLVLGMGRVIRQTTTYTITSKRVSGRKRIPAQAFRLRVEEAPIARIDNVIVDQSLLEQILGIGKLDFDTAGEREGDILHWWGVNDPQAVAGKIENVMSGDPWADEDEESPYFQTEPRLAARGYIEEDE